VSVFRYCVLDARLKLCALLEGTAMPNRREFLQTGVVVSAVAMNGLMVRSAEAMSAAGAGSALHKAIYDDRYAVALEFAAAVARQGVPIGALEDGDVTRFWYDELHLEWRRRPAAIAGTTQFGPMFVLEQLGAERGLRTALRIEHRPQPDGTLVHEITGDASTVALARGLSVAGLEWSVLMAALVCNVSAAATRQETAALAIGGTQPQLEAAILAQAGTQSSSIHYYTPRAVQQGYDVALDGPLFSWVLAPRGA
jgi:hypothetical protein